MEYFADDNCDETDKDAAGKDEVAEEEEEEEEEDEEVISCLDAAVEVIWKETSLGFDAVATLS